MHSEQAATAMHRLDHGSRATPRHDVAWTARPCRGLGGKWRSSRSRGAGAGRAAGSAAVAGCRGGAGGGTRALGGAGLIACGMCSATHHYTYQTFHRFLPVSPSSLASGKFHCLRVDSGARSPAPPTAPPRRQ